MGARLTDEEFAHECAKSRLSNCGLLSADVAKRVIEIRPGHVSEEHGIRKCIIFAIPVVQIVELQFYIDIS